jgi:hypothetical protein
MAGMTVGALGLGAAPPLLAAARGRHLRRSVAGRGAVVCRARAATGHGDRVSRLPAAVAAGSSHERHHTARLGGGAASGAAGAGMRRTVRCQGLFDNFKNPFASKDDDEAEPHITNYYSSTNTCPVENLTSDSPGHHWYLWGIRGMPCIRGSRLLLFALLIK